MTDPINILQADQLPEAGDKLQEIIARFRMAVAPMLNADLDNLAMNQSYLISSSAVFAGMTVGHMIAVGALRNQDRGAARKVVERSFRAGIDMGLQEATEAMAAQSGSVGNH